MSIDDGRVASPNRLSATPEPEDGLVPSGFDPARGTLKVWWIPQVPMKAFEAIVPDLATAAAILDVLSDYDAFQFENNVKGDYCNTGGLVVWRGDEWEDWESDTCDDFDAWRAENLPRLHTNGWGKPLSDTDRSPQGGNSERGSVRSTRAGAEGIAPKDTP